MDETPKQRIWFTVIEPGEDIEAALDALGDRLAADGVKCPYGVPVNECRAAEVESGEDCPCGEPGEC